MKSKNTRLLMPLLLLASTACGHAATVIYSNPFVYPSGTGTGLASNTLNALSTGWVGYNNNGTLQTETGSRVFMADRPFKNHPTNTYGVMIMDNGGSGPTKWAATTGLNIDSTQADLTFNWLGGNSTVGTGVRLLVQVGGTWYASNTFYTTETLSPTVGDFASATSTTAKTFTYAYSPAAAGWRSIAFNPTNFTADANSFTQATTDLTGNITGIGFLKQTTGIVRIADFHITIPEPSTALLGGIAALGLLRRRRN